MKVITVPKDKAAEIALDINEAKAEQLIEIELSDKEFKFLIFESRTFDLINLITGSLIGDFESEEISGEENLKKVIEVL